MISTILFPVDGSERSENAVRKGVEIAKELDAKIYAIYVVPPQNVLIGRITGNSSNMLDELNRIKMEEYENGKRILKNVESIIHEKFRPVEFNGKILEGDPKKEIINFVEENNVDLIVMASSKIHDKFLIGSVTEYVIRNAPCAVMIVK